MAARISRHYVFTLLLLILSLFGTTFGDLEPGYVIGTIDGQDYVVRDNRQPALYTGDFGDCTGSSIVNVTRFDAAYYRDNMTIVFHLSGISALKNETIMMFIGVYAYGEARFDLTFDPCNANIESACPVRSGIPIEASGIIPVSQKDVSGIPPLALEIPDFEGQAILRLFSNNSQSQIGCYTAVVTNGFTFSHPEWVGSIIGVFTGIALLFSFATAVYGDNLPEMRKHYAHSLSVGVVFAVWQHIFFSGALSMNWPSVLVAFWSNYAWAGGMIYSERMQNTINTFIGANQGNISSVGAAASGVDNSELGGGYDIHQLYKRELVDSTDGFSWYGDPVKPGIPLPGNYSGFAGTLARQNIPASNAFLTGFLWFLVLVAVIATSGLIFKLFRAHSSGYIALAILRTTYIGFFMLIFLTLFQFTFLASSAPVAVACVVFVIVFIGLGSLAGYACFHRMKYGSYVSEPDRLYVTRRKMFKIVPCYGFERSSRFPHSEDKQYAGSLPWWSVRAAPKDESVHQNEQFTKKFGWLASRFRRTRWWFFVVWLVYEFMRACFFAGASGQPMVQVFGLLAIEFTAFIGMVVLRPFEGQRLNSIVIYFLGFSKITTVALSAAFDHRFNLARIPATVVGIVIIVIQGVLTLLVLFAILLGAISSYMSIMRNRETIRPTRWNPIRAKYFSHLDFKELDVPRPATSRAEPKRETLSDLAIPKEPYFTVSSIRRMHKVEDEDLEFLNEIRGDYSATEFFFPKRYRDSAFVTGAPSLHSQMSSSILPQGARIYRASWSAHEFSETAMGRRRTSSQSLADTPEFGSCPSNKAVLVLNTRIGGCSEDLNRLPSSLSASPGITPAKSTSLVHGSSSLMPRPKSKPSSKSLAKRPQLRTVFSEDNVRCFNNKQPKDTTDPFAHM